ncbi:hypothetical protein BH24ACI2_BH24ACI2_04480 [soil metagenome]|jgi:hypothetical protein|nr:hypothetical protein [Acidobacteriota bacterium]
MKTISRIESKRTEIAKNDGFAIETTFVLFFLAVEFGRSSSGLTFDSMFLALTLLMIIVFPYFLPSNEKPDFGSWLLGRSFIAVFAVLLGVIFKQSLGVVLPETFRFLPMTLLILATMLSCYIQFYGFLKLRLAK